MIKKILTSRYKKEIEELSARIKKCEELSAISPQHYADTIKSHQNRIGQLQSKINDIELFKLIDFSAIDKNLQIKLFIIPLLILFFFTIFYFRPATVGRVIEQNAITYRIEVNQTFSNSSTYVFDINNNAVLTSLKISGALIGKGNAKVYLMKDDINYTIVDFYILKEKGVPIISGYVVKDDKQNIKDKNDSELLLNIASEEVEDENKTIINALELNETINETNETSQILYPTIQNKSINIVLQYDANENYDADNDGLEDLNGVVDLTVKGSNFGWDVDKEKLCTKWEIYNLLEDKATTLCYGGKECCNLINLGPTRENWDDAFYSVYGKDGVDFSNIISAQVIYANYSLEPENIYSEIINSEWANLSAAYNYGKTEFYDICKDTCILENFNESSYTIFIDIENVTLILNEITYILLPKNNKSEKLIFVNDIPNISITKNNNASINLTHYLLGIDDATIFSYQEQTNTNALFENELLTIVPNKDFVGTVYTFVTANKSNDLAFSNIFSINVQDVTLATNSATGSLYDINDPLIQDKLKKYTDSQIKSILNYNQISFNGYEIKNDVVIIHMTLDGKEIKWMTSLSTFNGVLRGEVG